MKSSTAIERLLRDLRVRIHVSVSDNSVSGAGGAGGGGVIGCGGPGHRPNFPPVYWNVLNNQGTRGDILLAPGPHPIYYRRTQSPSRSFSMIDRDEYRIEYMAHLLSSAPERLPLKAQDYFAVQWQGSDHFLAIIAEARSKAQLAFQAVIRQLHDRKLVSARQTEGMKIGITWEIRDIREDRSTPLPAILDE
jgi:hypothetical protein